ncbi:MAG: hypothetical protein JWQ96_2488 [Segetibacter sp.]|nr:hypothetical protein [Segetibacter sp.]
MEYGKIISVTGLGGLFELVGSKKDGAIVRSLEDKTTRFVASRVHNFSHLESIEVYTQRDNANLVEVFQAMDASSEELPDDKDGNAVKAYMQKVFPDMDFERVYSSDMKKMIKWFRVLKTNEVELKLSQAEDEEETEGDEEAVEVAAPDAAPVTAEETTEAAPAKKATRKKKTQE